MICGQVHLSLPAWLSRTEIAPHGYDDADARMALAIELAQRNVEHASGGPFGAALFTRDGHLLGVGVNRVEATHCSVAHAEMMAFMTAQTRLARYRLNADNVGVVLATSAQPCCQCFGASFWAGIDEMLIGARSEDVMQLTAFDEGPLPADWIGELRRRGIAVQRDVLRAQACAVLADYASRGGPTY